MADFLYKGVVDWFLDQMSQDALSPGKRMPSLRGLSKELKLSLNTIIHGYELLAEDGWIESRPKSGYFVCHRSEAKPALLMSGEQLRKLDNVGAKASWSCLAHRGALVDQSDAFLTQNHRAEEVDLPILGKGHLAVREAVSDHLKGLGIKSHASQLWLGRSPLVIFSNAVLALTDRDDTVLVITPCDPRIPSTLQSLGRRVISIAAGERGVDLDLVVRCFKEETIKLLVLPGQFAFPAGQTISNLSLRRWLAIIDELQLPTIEWDLCSHLAHRAGSVMTYKSLDSSDHIIYIGGVETKGVDRSASWCLPGRHHTMLDGVFLSADMALSDTQQQALSDALKSSGKRSLSRRARQVWANSERIKAHLETHLKDQASFAPSKGGMGLWLRLETPLSQEDMTALLASFRHAIVPGELMSHEPDAHHWLAINTTLDDVEPLAKKLAERLSLKANASLVEAEVQKLAKNDAPADESLPESKEDTKPNDSSVNDSVDTASSEAALGDATETRDVPEDMEDGDPPEDPLEAMVEASQLESTADTPEEEPVIEDDSFEGDCLEPDALESGNKESATANTDPEAIEPEKSAQKERRDASKDPLYNPMLDLINHDFG